MNRILPVFVVGFMICVFYSGSIRDGNASTPTGKAHGLALNEMENQTVMKISIAANGKTTVFELNNSPASKELYAQLPLSIVVKNYSNNEKIFYPPKKLGTTATPLADAQPGTLAYYAPWGNVVMFYGKFGSAAGLYELGHAISGSEHIREISGTAKVERFVVIEP